MFDSLHAPSDLGAARARLLAAADRLAGPQPVFHLGPAEGPDQNTEQAEGRTGPWPVIAPDAGVVVADSVLWRTGPGHLAALAGALGRERSLLFLEPTADVGWRRLAARLGRPLLRRAVGHEFEVDVPVVLRAAGLEVVDINRFGVGRGELRSYALGRAVSSR